jgi:hypothetical protein
MAADVSLPSVVLFFEGTGRLDMFKKIVSGLQRGGRRVHVFVGGGIRPPHVAGTLPVGGILEPGALDLRNKYQRKIDREK